METAKNTSRSIYELQSMLRRISACQPHALSVPFDGIYGVETVKAVTQFQHDHSLPPTGVTDLETWNCICNEYRNANVILSPACPIQITISPNRSFAAGDENPYIQLAQCMLSHLSDSLSSIPKPALTGCMDDDTCNCIQELQKLCSLNPDGKIDKLTWKNLVLLYQSCCN